MLISKEIQSAVTNLNYYAAEIQRLVKKQLDTDIDLGNKTGINVGIATPRFNSLGAMHAAASWIGAYNDNILAHLKHAEKYDKELFTEESNADNTRMG